LTQAPSRRPNFSSTTRCAPSDCRDVRMQDAAATLVLMARTAPSAPFECVLLAPMPSKRLTSLVKTGERVLFFAKMSDGQVHVGQLTTP